MSAAGWILSIVWTLIIIALVVAGIVWLVSASRREDGGPARAGSEPSARATLDRRLARGELTVEQYKQLRETIEDPVLPRGGDGPTRAASAPG